MAVPKLRFKDSDGREFPKWEEKRLGEVFDFMNYGMNAAAKPYDGKNKYLRITDIDENNNKYKENSFVSPNCILQEQYKLHEGDICFTRTGASVGKTYLYDSADGKVYFAGFLIRGHVNKNYITYFIFVQTLSEKYNRWVKVMSARTGQPGINMEEYKTFTIHVPVIEEQQKIADFLSTYDRQIDIQSQRVEAMKTRKKGLLQKIFSQEIRFRDDEGREYPEWEGKYLEKIASINDGVHQTPNYVETGVPFVSVENINDLENTNKFISLEDFKKDFKVYPEQDDILMTRIGDIGTSALVTKEGFAYYVSLALIKTKKNAIISKFLNQYIKSNIFQHELYKRSLQYAFPKKINKGEIGKCVVKVPSLPEQQKIADFLTTADHQIEVEEKRLETMKTIKKGLLQQMFI